ncbi:uroporphyrinogen decarboxylase [Hippea maritima]|uniref:Uroporphyrinogen decarboxylase n=1 Tax=Hippea maritima (strain ATCC 700847 / DSM 10411 / MH2) TaxID=760142 RepID=F2LX07_HIPMA|nr:uroporphyrinogen decarboxylase [Hippea maritima]AEA34191.1 Uroporphyrinogen decarboxylase [Hippea maritima DSM 10411]
MKQSELFLKTLKGEKAGYTPVWFMRQAGRFLKSYRRIREKYPLLEMFTNKELIVEITLLPKKLGVDALIIFSDILIPLKLFGAKIIYEDGKSPSVIMDKSNIQYHENLENLSFLFEAIGEVKRHKKDLALLGFAAAPFTLLCYVFGGVEFFKLRGLMYENPDGFKKLMDLTTKMTIDYLNMQLNSGCDAVQLFDSWAGLLDEKTYRELVLPFNQRIAKSIKPSIYFIKNSHHLNHLLNKMDFDGFSIDWRSDLVQVYTSTNRCVQGNLDNTVLFADEATIKTKTKEILKQTEKIPHIFNLGHGVLPQTDEEKIKMLVDFIHNETGRFS